MIPLFAQYCVEGAHQEMDVSEGYVPCILFRLEEGELHFQIVANNERPWLEGVTPEWRHRD
jgi:hypothetical protein